MAKSKGMGLLIAMGPKKSSKDDPFEPDDLEEDGPPSGLGAMGSEDDAEEESDSLGKIAVDPKLKASYEALCDATEDRDYGAMDRAFDDILDRKMAGR